MIFLYLVLLFLNLVIAHFMASFFITDITAHPIVRYLWMGGIYLLAYLLFGLLSERNSIYAEILRILKADLIAIVLIFAFLFISKQGESYSRFMVLDYFLLNLLMAFYIPLLKRHIFSIRILREPLLLLGDDKGIKRAKKWLEEEYPGFALETSMAKELSVSQGKKRNRSVKKNYQFVAIAADGMKRDELIRLVERYQESYPRIIVIPDRESFPWVNARIVGSVGRNGVAFEVPNKLLDPYLRGLKNIFDYSMTILIILGLSPLLLLLYLILFIATNGSPIYRQFRVGEGGRSFKIYKFRTMPVDAGDLLKKILDRNPKLRAEWEREHKLKEDPRVTPLGRFLRKSSLDELPQLINVLKGEMSLVGPRPIVEAETVKYGDDLQYYLAVKPGITGLWQVSGRNDLEYAERVFLDKWYVRNWSVDMDLIILLKTVGVVLQRDGSY